MVITVSCPSCSASFPVDTNKIPVGGVSVRCSSCSDVFRVERPQEEAPLPTLPVVEAAPEPEPTFETPTFEAPAVEPSSTPEQDPSAENDFSFGTATPPAAAEEESSWVTEREEDIDAGSLTIDPVETVESSVEEAKATQPASEPPVEPDLADPMALPAEPADTFFAPSEPTPEAEAPSEPDDAPAVTGFSFGKRDPKDKARRLARVLVSDMISYNPDRHERALANGSIKEDFEEEIQKSWKEYVEQVGEEMANENPFWVEALNDVLAKGQQIF